LRRLLIPVPAVAAVVAGTAAIVAPRQPIGWFAYAPLADATFTLDQLVHWTPVLGLDTC
jgi:hypothetical protein